MKRTFLAASLALLPLMFACQPELDAPSEQQPTTLEKNDTTADVTPDALPSGDLGVMGLMTGTPYASMEEVEIMRDEQQGWIHVETQFYVTFWADIARTIPVNLGTAIQLNYQHWYYDIMNHYSMISNLSTNLQPGSHSYYIGTGIYECNYTAHGDPEYRCDQTLLSLRSGVGYNSSY